MFGVSARTTTSGPLWNGGFDRAVNGYMEDVAHTIGETGRQDIHTELGRVIRNPSSPPFYQNQITLTPVSPNLVRIHDQGVVYGPWLAGTSSRNKTTRFRGYGVFRRMRTALQLKAPGIANQVLQRWKGRMG